jgi:hypothetical protein
VVKLSILGERNFNDTFAKPKQLASFNTSGARGFVDAFSVYTNIVSAKHLCGRAFTNTFGEAL